MAWKMIQYLLQGVFRNVRKGGKMEYFNKEIRMVPVEVQKGRSLLVTNVFLDEVPYLESMTRFQEKIILDLPTVFEEIFLPSSGLLLQEIPDFGDDFFVDCFLDFYKMIHGNPSVFSGDTLEDKIKMEFIMFLMVYFQVDPRLLQDEVVVNIHFTYFNNFFSRNFMKNKRDVSGEEDKIYILISLDLLEGFDALDRSISWEKFFRMIRDIVRNPEEGIEVPEGTPDIDSFDIVLLFVKYYLDAEFFGTDFMIRQNRKIFVTESRDLLHEIIGYVHDLGWISLSYFLSCVPKSRRSVLPARETGNRDRYAIQEDIKNYRIILPSGRDFIVHSVFEDVFLRAGLGFIWESFLTSGAYRDNLDLPDDFWELFLLRIMNYQVGIPTRMILDFLKNLEKMLEKAGNSKEIKKGIGIHFGGDLFSNIRQRGKMGRKALEELLSRMTDMLQEVDVEVIQEILKEGDLTIILGLMEKRFDLRKDPSALKIYTEIWGNVFLSY